jgi:hypothetical protein
MEEKRKEGRKEGRRITHSNHWRVRTAAPLAGLANRDFGLLLPHVRPVHNSVSKMPPPRTARRWKEQKMKVEMMRA